MRIVTTTLSFIFFTAAFMAANAAFMSTGSTNNGYSSARSSSFASNSAAGAISGGKSSSPSFSSTPGAFPAALATAAAPPVSGIQFVNDSEIQQSSTVVCRVTVETTTSTWLTNVYFRISNAGATSINTAVWQATSSTDTADTSNTPYRVSFVVPLAASLFTAGSNNYIQWKAVNATTVSGTSSVYQITVANNAPAITITQPDVKTGIATTLPQIEAIIASDVGIVPSALSVTIARTGGATVGTYTPNYSASTNKLTLAYNDTPLADGAAYTLTISATDTLGATTNKTQTFTIKGGAIADLVPYPSPFDPANGSIKLNYTLSKRADVTVNIYNMGRKLIKNVIDNQARNAGTCEETWDGTNYAGDTMANGVYFCEVIAKDSEGEHRRYTAMAILGK
jgi:hypothetical protein